MADLDSTTLTQRLALISVTRLDEAGDTPAHAGEIARDCSRHVDAIDADVVGSVSEAAATRALNELEAEDFVRMSTDGSDSPVGKGRPEYEPEVDAETLMEAFDDDERLDQLLDRL
jgi:predicted ArsR family transcriptional regulator